MNVTKFEELAYKRYTVEEAEAAFNLFKEAAERAKRAEDVLEAREKYIRDMREKYYTAHSLSYCRYTQNTADEFYMGEVEYYDNNGPFFTAFFNAYAKIMLESPFRKGLEESLNPIIFKNYEIALKTHSDEVIPDEQEENAIATEYSRLMSSLTCEWNGEELPLSVVRGNLESVDRDIRRLAAESIGNGLKAHAKELDGIYDRLVKVRDRIAKKLGYKNFVELGYYRMGRIDYTKSDVEKFRANVIKDLVPVISKLKAQIKENLGLDEFKFYDDEVYLKEGNPVREISSKEVFENAQIMYDEMNSDIGDFMRSMINTNSFDLEARGNKFGGGYCIDFPSYEHIFILGNFNGACGDIDLITHEFGHAYAMSKVYECGDWEIGLGSMETAECHSMSMEFLSWNWMNLFFKDKAKAYKYKHLCDSLSFIPYGCIVDEFQHVVYENPEMTPEDRKAAYRALEEKYRPYMSIEGIPYLEEGTRWQYQMHIYESPFYYIDYCLAQTVSLGFMAMAQRDYSLALNKYIEFCKKGGQKPFSTLVKEAEIANPFTDGALKEIATAVEKVMEELK